MKTNQQLFDLGLNDFERTVYCDEKSQQGAMDKTAITDRQQIRDAYLQAITDLDQIIAFGTPTLAQLTIGVKNMALIQKKLLLYLKAEMID